MLLINQVGVRVSVKKNNKASPPKKSGRQASLCEDAPPKKDPCQETKEAVAQHEINFSPITDRKSYDSFIKNISIKIYTDFDNTLRSGGIERPELSLVGFDLKKASSELEEKMVNYVAMNARLIVDRAFTDIHEYAHNHMPRVLREMHQTGSEIDRLPEFVEGKVQRDIVMEIRAIAMNHIPDEEKYKHASKLKEF